MTTDGRCQTQNWKNPERGTEITPLLLKPREAAKALNISERSLFSLTQTGSLRAVRVGRGAKRYALSDIQAYIASLRRA